MRPEVGALMRWTPVLTDKTFYAVVVVQQWEHFLVQLDDNEACQPPLSGSRYWICWPADDWKVLGNINGEAVLAFEACIMAEEWEAAARLAADEYRARGLL